MSIWDKCIKLMEPLSEYITDRGKADTIGGEMTRAVNCTPDVRELYDRVRTINVKLKHRKEMIEIAKDLNLTTYHEAEKLTQAFPGWDRYEWNNRNYFEFKAVAQLLRTRVFRSSFRQSLRDQVLVWLDESVSRFEKPLSPRQLAMITRR